MNTLASTTSMHADSIRAGQTATPADNDGTLLWIGSRRHPEMADAYRACESLVPQLAYRRSVEDACERPAQFVAAVIFARTERSPIAPERLDHLKQSNPGARFTCLLSSGCEGEMRTGDPWPGCKRVYWHRWNQEFPDLRFRENSPSRPLYLTIVAASLQHAEVFLEVAAQNHWPATWVTPGEHCAVRSATHVLWDDSAAGPADRGVWTRRLSLFASPDRPSASASSPLHGWLAGFPRWHDWREARAAGVEWLLSKPVSLSALFRFTSATAGFRRMAL